MARTFEEKMQALADKYAVTVTFSTAPPKGTGEITLLPGVRGKEAADG